MNDTDMMSWEDPCAFVGFPKIARLVRTCIITEKIDGTNASVHINDYGDIWAGKRTGWITPDNDNFGFAAWVEAHKAELVQLGPGRHFGEWWGNGIQRGYGLPKGDKRFSLFNVAVWGDGDEADKKRRVRPACCYVVPVLSVGDFTTNRVEACLTLLAATGSQAAPGFMKPEGVIVYHTANNVSFKQTYDSDRKSEKRTV